MDLNISFQHKRFLKLRDFVRELGFPWCFEADTLENEWTFPILRDFPYVDDNTDVDDSEGIVWDDYGRLSDKEWALEILETNPDIIDWERLSAQPWAKHLIEANMNKADKLTLFGNPAMMEYIDANMDKVHWSSLSLNPAYIVLLSNNLDKIDWRNLCNNPAALHLLEKNIEKVCWRELSKHSWALDFIDKHHDECDIDWIYLASQPWAIELLKKHFYQITYDDDRMHAFMKNPAAGPTIRKHRNMFHKKFDVVESCGEFISEFEDAIRKDPSILQGDLYDISDNRGAMHLIEQSNCVDYRIWKNSSVITYDYDLIKQTNAWMKEALVQYFYRPDKVQHWLEANPSLHIEDYTPFE